MIRRISAVAMALALVVAASSSAGAQLVSYTTVGTFSGTGCTATSCTFSGITLSFNNQTAGAYVAPTDGADLGSFSALGMYSGAGGNISSDAMFQLMVYQTTPGTPDSKLVVGNLSGSLGFDPAFGNLYFTPNAGSSSFMISNVQYDLVLENGSVVISPPLTAQNPNTTILKADISVAPEPASMTLLATGLVGIFGAARRRRKSVVA